MRTLFRLGRDEEESANLNDIMNVVPDDPQYQFSSSAFKRIDIAKFVKVKPWLQPDHKILTEEDELVVGGEEYERPFYFVTGCTVG